MKIKRLLTFLYGLNSGVASYAIIHSTSDVIILPLAVLFASCVNSLFLIYPKILK